MKMLASEYLDAEAKVAHILNTMWKECQSMKGFGVRCGCGASPERSMTFKSMTQPVKLCLDCGGTL